MRKSERNTTCSMRMIKMRERERDSVTLMQKNKVKTRRRQGSQKKRSAHPPPHSYCVTDIRKQKIRGECFQILAY
jgi:hypothetical protein